MLFAPEIGIKETVPDLWHRFFFAIDKHRKHELPKGECDIHAVNTQVSKRRPKALRHLSSASARISRELHFWENTPAVC